MIPWNSVMPAQYHSEYGDAFNRAFENFFHDFVSKYAGKYDWGTPIWGPDYWESWGVTVDDSRIRFKSPAHRTWFLLKWS
jgi:hypothetical protein